jgi:methyltransferase (TIGR00027 family)
MEESQVSFTALLTAYARAYHATHDDPKIFDDFLAHHLFTEEERTYFGKGLAESLKFLDPERAAACPDQATALAWYMRLQGGPVTLSRSRYTEDSLETAVRQGVRQYVILGAGLDTFAFRRPEMLKQLQVFEIDHPAMQAFKRQRLSKLGWEIPAQLHWVPVDFAKENLATALDRSAYDPQASSFFSWLGVTYYLTRDVVFATLQAIADSTPAGSTVMFDYFDTDAFVPEKAATRMQRMQAIVRGVGEPIQTGFDPSTLAADLASLGLRLHENLSPSDIEGRYFQGRMDGYHAFQHAHFARAGVA